MNIVYRPPTAAKYHQVEVAREIVANVFRTCTRERDAPRWAETWTSDEFVVGTVHDFIRAYLGDVFGK